MKFIILLITLAFNLNAADMKLEVVPKKPVKNEVFKLVFTIPVEDSAIEPNINFRPIGLEVVGKSNPSFTSSTTFINGTLKSTKSYKIEYDVIAQRPGYVMISNIKVDVAGKSKIIRDKRIMVANSAPKPRDIIAVAVVSNEQPYVNESVLVRYYIYNKIPISTMDIKKFPKLDQFLKRYHNEQARPERVNYNNQIYTRRVVYTAQIFPSKSGKYKIDPITLLVTYPDRRTNPFGGFGIGFGRNKQLSITSDEVVINVRPLPTANVPASFTGLVGQHKFRGSVNKAKLLSNEPLEIKLIVEGEGSLEVFESPQIITDPAMEEFETTSDLTIAPNFTGTKTFEYTYLGRASTELNLSDIKFSYFDPKIAQYIEKSVDLGMISVKGGLKNEYSNKSFGEGAKETSLKVDDTIEEFNWNPIYKVKNSFIYYAKPILMVLGALVGVYLLILLILYLKGIWSTRKIDPLLKKVSRNGAQHTEIIKLLSKLEEQDTTDENLKNYLNQLKEQTEIEYKNGEVKRVKLKRNIIKQIAKAIS
jgi:hypothetical protein